MGEQVSTSLTKMSSPSGSGSNDTCAYYALEAGASCRQPRTCYDCLNKPVESEFNGCVVSLYGACESMSYYDYAEDYRVADSSNDNGTVDNLEGGWYHMFPSVNSTYCEAQDEACVHCRAIASNASEENNYLASTTKYCLGTSGCVCILGCESPDWSSHVRSDCEESSSDSTTTASSGSDSSTQGPGGKSAMGEAMWVFGSVLVLFICAALFELYRQRRQLSQRRRRPSSKRSSDLRLSHWHSLQQQLIAREKSSGGTVISSNRGLVPLSDRPSQEI